jgi:hypothetical protein
MKKYTFIHPDPTLQNNLMAFGLECDQGWYPLIEELFDKIQDFIDANPKWSDLELLQVKEKFGELCVYTSGTCDEILDMIDAYAKKSIHICEVCGKPGTLQDIGGHWYKTICKECLKRI